MSKKNKEKTPFACDTHGKKKKRFFSMKETHNNEKYRCDE